MKNWPKPPGGGKEGELSMKIDEQFFEKLDLGRMAFSNLDEYYEELRKSKQQLLGIEKRIEETTNRETKEALEGEKVSTERGLTALEVEREKLFLRGPASPDTKAKQAENYIKEVVRLRDLDRRLDNPGLGKKPTPREIWEASKPVELTREERNLLAGEGVNDQNSPEVLKVRIEKGIPVKPADTLAILKVIVDGEVGAMGLKENDFGVSLLDENLDNKLKSEETEVI